MSHKDGFGGGFLLGSIVGGVVGGLIGATLASRRDAELTEDETDIADGAVEAKKLRKRQQIRSAADEGLEMEATRRSLEDKIAQLNATIDDVRNQLSNVNGTSSTTSENSSQDS